MHPNNPWAITGSALKSLDDNPQAYAKGHFPHKGRFRNKHYIATTKILLKLSKGLGASI